MPPIPKKVIRPGLPLMKVSEEGPKPKPPQQALWQERLVTVFVDDADNPQRQINGLVHGQVVVHSRRGRAGWTVSSLTTGYAIVFLDDLETAKKVGEFLWRECSLALCRKTVSEMVAEFPKWAIVWCVRCREAGKWIDPDKLVPDK